MTTDLLSATTPVSTEVAQFLAHLAVGMHKLRAYPAGHPMRHAAVHAGYTALTELQQDQSDFRIGVARNQLTVGDTTTDPAHFIISDLALRLHRRQVGSLTFHAGITEAEFTAALEVLAAEPPRGRGIAAEEMVVSPSPNVEIAPIAFDALALNEGVDGANQVDLLWQELAGLVSGATSDMTGGLGGSGTGGGQGEGIGSGGDGYARAVMERLRAPEVRTAFLSTLERLGRMSQALDGEERAQVEARLGDLLATLPKNAIEMLLDVDIGQRDGLARLMPAVDWLPTVALVELIESAAAANNQGISAVLMRLLRKLANQGKSAGHQPASGDRDLRVMVKSLLENWTLADPNSKSHAHILDTLARHETVSTADGAPTGEGIRVLQIALETEAVGDLVLEAVEMVVASRQIEALTALLEETPLPNRAAAEIWKMVLTPAQARRIFGDPDLDPEVAHRLLARVDDSLVDLLLDRVLLFRHEAVRRDVIERIFALGPTASLALLKRIEGVAGEQRQQLLQVLQTVAQLPPGFDARAYATAPEPLVRIEALRLMMRNPDDRDDAVHAALADDDERVVDLGLEAGLADMPRQSLSRLMLLLNSPKRSVALKARAIPVLAQFDTPSIREWLITNLVIRRGWFRRRKLAPKTPLLVARLRLVAVRWPDHPQVAVALELARRSGDPELTAAARAEGSNP